MSLETRLRYLEDIEDIRNLEGRYARTWDSGDAAGWADVFTEDGAWEAPAAGNQLPASLAQGRTQLEELCRQCAGFLSGLHFLHVNEVTIDGDEAHALVYFDFRGLNRQPRDPSETLHQLVSGYYEVDYVRIDVGWRMKYRLEKVTALNTTAHFGGGLELHHRGDRPEARLPVRKD